MFIVHYYNITPTCAIQIGRITSVITTTAPMHFKNLHPFSLSSRFPPSPYHQFSNSSMNHDFFDRYMSHDSHQPLLTPLIGIERTQDLLSLKLPPHGPDETETQRFPFEEPQKSEPPQAINNDKSKEESQQQQQQDSVKSRKESTVRSAMGALKGFPFNYKASLSNSQTGSRSSIQREPIDLNVSYECDNEDKNTMFNESMKHFNQNHAHQSSFYERETKHSPIDGVDEAKDADDTFSIAQQYQNQESMFGIDPSKQKFQYVLAAPISVATKLNEDTMTYLNQGQAYEIKLENITDVAEAKKGFMCSIINIGFHERHMQQAENELWQQWSQQHPNEKIFSVDMKLSYNVFGVESDGLNKYEFLWDSSKAAGVFIRINSISTEFTAKKHGGEKGVPFKLSIETFSYNSKTHDSYFISAACSQIKVFKPKGAERKIRSDRDKIFKRPPSEQEKYHKSCDHTTFKDCSLASLHPMADGSLCYYRHSHGHFASKQNFASSSGGNGSTPGQASSQHQASDDLDHGNNSSQNNSPEGQQNEQNRESDSDNNNNSHNRDYQEQSTRQQTSGVVSARPHTDYSTARLIQSSYGKSSFDAHTDQSDMNFAHQNNVSSAPPSSYNHSNEIVQPTQFNHQMYHCNPAIRGVPGLPGIGHAGQHFGMGYYGHPLPTTIPPHVPPPPASYGLTGSSTMPHVAHQSSHGSFPIAQQQHLSVKEVSSFYRQLNNDKPTLGATTATSATTQVSQSGSFRASNLSISSSHANFQSYMGSTDNGTHQNSLTDHCPEADQQTHETKNSIAHGNNNPTYHHHNNANHHHHDNYEPPSHPFYQSNSTTSTENRQRSTSASFTSNGCGENYPSSNYGGSPVKQAEGYSTGDPSIESPIVVNQWSHNNHPTSQVNFSSSRISNQHENNNSQATGYNYESNNQHYDSEQGSPNKTHHHHTNDSSSSCCSKSKNNSSIHPYSIPRDCYDTTNKQSSRGFGIITASSDCHEVAAWFLANRFVVYSKTFNNFCGSDLLRLSKNDLIEICGLIDGIRLYNSLHNQPIKPKRVLYVSYEHSEIFNPIYLYDVSLAELIKELSNVFRNQVIYSKNSQEDKQRGPGDKSTMNSTSSCDSRSSMGTISNENGSEDLYNQRNPFLTSDSENMQRRLHASPKQKSPYRIAPQSNYNINRLLVDGLTSVKIVATEQVVQLLENESLWELSLSSSGNLGQTEACLSACRSRKKMN